MSTFVNPFLIRSLTSEETSKEFQSLRRIISEQTITKQLLDAIMQGSLPTSIFVTWLTVCNSPEVIKQSLRQKHSLRIRFLGIKQFKGGLESAQWKELWQGLGGTAGLIDILSDLSVLEVRAMCKAISQSARIGDNESKRTKVTELFKGLHPDSFPDVKFKTMDLRPLTRYYQALIPSCTAELVNCIIARNQEGKWQYIRERELLKHHSSIVGRSAVSVVFKDQTIDTKVQDRLRALSTQFPSRMTSEPGFSTSMAFSLDLLHKLVETGIDHIDDKWTLENLIRPLLKRAIRKRVSWSRTQEIAITALRYLDQHRSATKHLTNDRGDVLHMIALCWSRRSTMFEAPLKCLLGMVYSKTTRLEEFSNLLAGIPKSRGYPLLQLCCQEVMGIDLDVEQGLHKVRGPLTQDILLGIEAYHALELFRRLRKARGDVKLVELGQYTSVLVTTRTSEVYEGDPDIYYLVLLNENSMYADAEIYATRILETRKKITRTSSTREARTEHALSVWACASSSGSLKLLSETVQWAKSFVRDQLTASKLFSTYFDETCRLLSGFLPCNNGALKPRALRERVKHANAIMLNLLDIACLALREPFFRPDDWYMTIDIFTRVVNERMRLLEDVQTESKASDNDMYNAVWEDTIMTLIQAEKLINQEDHVKLAVNNIANIAAFDTTSKDTILRATERVNWMFLDNLAKARNELWEELRRARYPEVLTLPEPFPRGLAVQHLLANWSPNVANLHEFAPYIASRVRAALFVESTAALKPVPSAKSTQQAIGSFIDSYQYALGTHIPEVCEPDVKQKRLREVWNYATGPLSERGMNPDEVYRYWEQFVPSHLRATLTEILPKRESNPWPLVPKSEDSSETQEWNPFEGKPADIKIEARKLGGTTYVDLSTRGRRLEASWADTWSYDISPSPQVPAENRIVGSIWGSQPKTNTETEAAALAALLYLDAKYGTGERLLATPFPSPVNIRYPCLYLDEEFLACDELRVSDATEYLSRHIGTLPLLLVHETVSTLVRKLGLKQNTHVLDKAAFTLIRALSKSDKPGLAFGLAIQAIIGQPNASSWHRMLFHSGYLQRLPASDVRSCIDAFADAIGERLDAQRFDLQDQAESEKHSGTEVDKAERASGMSNLQAGQAFVKITTLKSLAQILQGSVYIGDDVALDILSNFSKKVTHIDVRLSILKAFLSKLKANQRKLWGRVLSALELFIPLAGSLNERDPMTDSDWEKAEETMIMPKTQLMNYGWQDNSPMLDSLVQFYITLMDGELLHLYSERIMIPLIETLKQQTVRWTMLFLRKHAPNNSNISKAALPPIPRDVTIWKIILTRPETRLQSVPWSLIDEYTGFLRFRANPPECIQALNKSFEENLEINSMPEVETWLDLYSGGLETTWLYGMSFSNISSFDDQGNGDNSAYVTRSIFQEKWLDIFKVLLWADAPNYDQLNAFVSTLTNFSNMKQTWWHEYGRTALESTLSYVDSIRTQDWEKDPGRKPAVLPDTFPWRLSLLSYPLNCLSSSDNTAHEQACEIFANELSVLLDEIRNSMYHPKLEMIKVRICDAREFNNPGFVENLMLSALYLGDISKTRLSWLTTLDLLRVDLATDMMLGNKGLDNEIFESRLKALLDTWMSNENEEVRRAGYRVQREFFP